MLRLSNKEILNKPPDYPIPFLSWLDTKSANTFFFSESENEYKILGTKSKQAVNMSLFLALSKKYKIIEEFKDKLKGLKIY